MTTDEERDLAVLARREAAESRRRQYARDNYDGPDDSYWDDQGPVWDDSRYRAAMRDAGRGSMLR